MAQRFMGVNVFSIHLILLASNATTMQAPDCYHSHSLLPTFYAAWGLGFIADRQKGNRERLIQSLYPQRYHSSAFSTFLI